jgi:uncharacterized membrane protein YjgN (DUF898 family)
MAMESNLELGKQSSPLFEYDGRVGELYGIFLSNLIFTILTLGIFRFWAITRTRRYIWSRLRFQGERFEYTGKGFELFLGLLVACAVVIGIFLALVTVGEILYLLTHVKAFLWVAIALCYLVTAMLAAGAYFSAQRYRLSRTLWCGIRGGMSGSAYDYGMRKLGYGLLCVLTLGQLIPWATLRLAERRINASSFGDASFHFEGRAGRVYPTFLLTLLLSLASLFPLGLLEWKFMSPLIALARHGKSSAHDALAGPAHAHAMQGLFLVYVLFVVGEILIQCFYTAALARHITGNTTLGGRLQFSSRVTGTGLLGLIFGNLLIVVFTLGLGYPLALQRVLRFLVRTLTVQGSIDPSVLGQNKQDGPGTGEGMLNLFDHGGMI